MPKHDQSGPKYRQISATKIGTLSFPGVWGVIFCDPRSELGLFAIELSSPTPSYLPLVPYVLHRLTFKLFLTPPVTIFAGGFCTRTDGNVDHLPNVPCEAGNEIGATGNIVFLDETMA